MRTTVVALLLAAAVPAAAIAASVPAYVTKALAAPAREADRKDDARRKGAEVTAFAGVKPGQTVVDLLPGGGYWTRIFSGVVGPKGKVYDVWPAAMVAPGARGEARMKALVGQPGMENVEALPVDLAAYKTPPADVVFTSQNIHDLPNTSFGGMDITAFSKMVLASLKPGGRFIVIDHSGKPGSGMTETDTLHRIEPKVVKDAIVAAGFKFAGESPLLAHPADDHTLKVFDPSLRGNTDQFLYAFEKPKK